MKDLNTAAEDLIKSTVYKNYSDAMKLELMIAFKAGANFILEQQSTSPVQGEETDLLHHLTDEELLTAYARICTG